VIAAIARHRKDVHHSKRFAWMKIEAWCYKADLGDDAAIPTIPAIPAIM
jgi:hypothetical protein